MKKLLLMIIVALPIFIYSQENDNIENNKSDSEVIKFSLSNKKITKKEWIAIGREGNIDLKKIIVTNLQTGESVSGIEVNSYSNVNGASPLGIVDRDEINSLIEFLTLINTETQSKPKTKTLFTYTSKDLLEVTAMYNTFDFPSKWKIEITPSFYYYRFTDSKSINVNKLDKIIELFRLAKASL